MDVEEQGVVIEERGEYALVSASESGHCAGCAASGACRGAEGGRTVEAVNEAGASKGDRVVLSLPSGELLKASFQIYMVPVMAILAGAGLAQYVVGTLAGAEAAGTAAGVGGIAGGVLAVLVQRYRVRRDRAGRPLRPRIVKVL